MEGRPQANECKWALEAGNGKEIDPPLEPAEGMQACRHVDFRPVKAIWGFWHPNYKLINLLF